MVRRIGMGRVYNATARAGLSRRRGNDGGMQLVKAATSLRPHIVQVMARRQGRILTTEEIYALVADLGVAGFNPSAKRDRNLVNRELSDLAGYTTQGHSKASPQLIMRVSRGHYIYRESVPESVRMALYSVQWGVCPGCGFHQPHNLRFEIDHIVALSDDGEHETRNLQLLCPYCNRVKGTQGSHGFRMKMTELRAHNVGTGVMVDEREAALTGRRLAHHHLESADEAS